MTSSSLLSTKSSMNKMSKSISRGPQRSRGFLPILASIFLKHLNISSGFPSYSARRQAFKKYGCSSTPRGGVSKTSLRSFTRKPQFLSNSTAWRRLFKRSPRLLPNPTPIVHISIKPFEWRISYPRCAYFPRHHGLEVFRYYLVHNRQKWLTFRRAPLQGLCVSILCISCPSSSGLLK